MKLSNPGVSKQERFQQLKDACEVGSKLIYGKNGKAPIEWIVLDKTDAYLLLMTEKPIIEAKYSASDSFWRTSRIRTELNGHYFDLFFNEQEKELICENELSNGSDGKTTDKVYILSRSEINKYLRSKKERICGKDWQTREAEYVVVRGIIRQVHSLNSEFYAYIRPVICLRPEIEKRKTTPKGYKAIFKYSKDENGIIISGYSGEDKHMVIPEEIDGLPVYKIKKDAFEKLKRVNEVTLPASLQCVEVGAFGREIDGNDSLQKVNINDLNAWASVEVHNEFFDHRVPLFCNGKEVNDLILENQPVINESCFATCPKIKTINISGAEEIRNRAFYATNALKVRICAEGTRIYTNAFGAIKQLDLEGHFSYIGTGAFWPEEINITGTIDKLGYNAFNLSNVVKIICSAEMLDSILDASKTDDAAVFCENYLVGKITCPAELNEVIERYICKCKCRIQGRIERYINHFSYGKNTGFEDLLNRFGIIFSDNQAMHKKYSKNDFTYSIIDGEIIIEQYNGDQPEVIVPGEIDGYPVTEVDAAFRDKSMEKVVLPDSIHYIGENCFYHCSELISIELPESIEVIEDHCFEGCKNLREIKLPEKLRTIGQWAFLECSQLSAIVLPPSVRYLDNAFHYCVSLSQVKLPDGLMSINDDFWGCDRLKNISFPDSLFELGAEFYSLGSNFEEISIAPESIINNENIFLYCKNLRVLNCSDKQMEKVFKNLNDNAKIFVSLGCIKTNVEIREVRKYIEKKKNILIENAIKENFYDVLQKLIEGISDKELQDWIDFAAKNRKTTSAAVLLECQKQRSSDPTFVLSDMLNIEKTDIKPQFAYTKDNGVIRIGQYKGNDGILHIPEQINGMPVTEIKAQSYKGKGLKEVILPKTIIRIGRDVFEGNDIESVEIEDLSAWENIVFETRYSNPIGNNTIFKVNGSEISTLEYIGEEITIKPYTFAGLSSLQKLTIQGKKIVIGEEAFSGCANLNELIISGTLKTIEHYAFLGCSFKRIDTSLANMKKIMRSSGSDFRESLSYAYVSGGLTVNEDAATIIKEFLQKNETDIIRRYINDNDSASLSRLISMISLNPEKLDYYIYYADGTACVQILENYKKSIS